MIRRELCELLYQDPQPITRITDLVLSKTHITSCSLELPDKDGDYLIHHLIYGWCLYGFTLEDGWGEDNLVYDDNNNPWYYKVSKWAKLDFLEETPS